MSRLKNKIVLLLGFLVLCITGFVVFSKYNISNSYEDGNKSVPTFIPIQAPIPAVTPTPIPFPTLTPKRWFSKHLPVKLDKGNILVSFRIDDITFTKSQKIILERALYLARKYNITFDLAVIAKTFDEKADPETFKLYEMNKDVFEIVAHGYDHLNYENVETKSEFGGVPTTVQEEHIKKMLNIFIKYKLTLATKIFFLPWHSGDENTIKLAKKYNYKILTQNKTPNNALIYKDSNILVTKSMSGINIDAFNKILKKNPTHIEVVTHPATVDYGDVNIWDNFINAIIKSDVSSKIKFDFVSRLL